MIADWRYVVWFVVALLLSLGFAVKSKTSNDYDANFGFGLIALSFLTISAFLFFQGFSK